MEEDSDIIEDEEAVEEEFLKKAKFRRHSSAVVSGLNGFHKRPVQLYLVRINPGCRIIWLYMLQVILNFFRSFFLFNFSFFSIVLSCAVLSFFLSFFLSQTSPGFYVSTA